jgi:hypothetical protein
VGLFGGVDCRSGSPFTAFMRSVVISLASAALLIGCGTPAPGGVASRESAGMGRRQPTRQFEGSTIPDVTLDRRVHGRVVSANLTLRFVVMEFPVWSIPAVEQRLSVYRGDQKMGEIKVTGPIIDTTVAGDILVGEALMGDQVRED